MIFSEQEVIDAFETTGRRVMREVLDMSWDEIIVSDLSDLGDFCSSGIPEGSIPKNATWHQICNIWDAWVIAKISDLYGVKISKTNIRLVELFRKVEKSLENLMLN